MRNMIRDFVKGYSREDGGVTEQEIADTLGVDKDGIWKNLRSGGGFDNRVLRDDDGKLSPHWFPTEDKS